MKSNRPSILTINGGSSCIKFASFELPEPFARILEGKIERIGLPHAYFTVKGQVKVDNLAQSLPFSFARAMQQPALEIWRGSENKVLEAQQALYRRAVLNRAARHGEHDVNMERK